jgi:repressor LexA
LRFSLDTYLTRRQQDIVEFLLRRKKVSQRAPTLDEICAALGLRSRGSLHKHIMALVDAGVLEPMTRKHRGARLSAGASPPSDAVPLLGRIAAGTPIEAIAQAQPVQIPESLRSDQPCYVLEVRGDSMIEEGILDGDWVVVESRSAAADGEIVVALVNGANATLKRIERRRGQVILHPANSAMQPLLFEPEQVAIQGVVTGLLRTYRRKSLRVGRNR